ncbi:MAG TPA: hypothetical protein VL092_08340 [Chitinophagaceae bacterium]|nr:hypothetical protein [Chitinophagaceae bacterium]
MGLLLTLLLFSCSTPSPKGALQPIQTARIHEEGNHVLHGLPISIQLLSDSLAGIHFDATRYTVYNYYTGRMVSSLLLDSSVLPDLLLQARAYYPHDYQLMSMQEGREIGVPVLSVDGVFYSKEKQQYFLFISAAFAVDTFIDVRGVKEPATATHHVCYVAVLNRHFAITSRYTILRGENVAPAFLFGGLLQEDRLLVPNIELEHIDTPGFGMLCSVALEQDRGRISSIPVPFDYRTRLQRKNHIFDQVSFADVDGNSYYVSDGCRILHCRDSVFRSIYAMDTNEHVYNLYYNHTRNLLYINTRFGEQALGSKVFTLDTAGKSLSLIDSSHTERSVDFINDSLILSIHKTPDEEHYAFSLYNY